MWLFTKLNGEPSDKYEMNDLPVIIIHANVTVGNDTKLNWNTTFISFETYTFKQNTLHTRFECQQPGVVSRFYKHLILS